MSETPENPFGDAMPDLGGLLESAQQMMEQARAAADQVVEGDAGGVRISTLFSTIPLAKLAGLLLHCSLFIQLTG